MTNRLAVPSKELQLYLVGPSASFKASRIQRASLGADIPSTMVDELGSASHVGVSKDTPNVTVSFSAFDTGIKIFSVLTGTNPSSYPGAGVDISSLSAIDAIFYVKSSTANTMIKCAHARRLQIRDFSYSYSVDGEATEDYTAIGSERRWFMNNVIVDSFTTGTTFTLTQTPIQLKNGNYALSVIVDGSYLTEVSTAPVAGAGTYRLNGVNNKTLTLGDAAVTSVLVVYQTAASLAWADVSDAAAGPAAVKGKDINVKISANQISRVQSVTLNGSLNVQPVNEMGNKAKIAGYQRQVPTIDGTLTVLDKDTDLISLLTYGVIGSGIEWQPGEGCTNVPLTLTVEITDPCVTTVPYTVLKTIYLSSILPTGDTYSINVNGNASTAFNFKSLDAHCYVYSGAKS
jgi:hypothetical protein